MKGPCFPLPVCAAWARERTSAVVSVTLRVGVVRIGVVRVRSLRASVVWIGGLVSLVWIAPGFSGPEPTWTRWT